MTTKYPAASEAATITVSVRTVHNRRGYMQYRATAAVSGVCNATRSGKPTELMTVEAAFEALCHTMQLDPDAYGTPIKGAWAYTYTCNN